MRILRITILLATFLATAHVVAQTTPVSISCTSGGGTNCTSLIPDGFGSLQSTITVASGVCSGEIRALTVPVSITHDWVGDLQITVAYAATPRTLLLPSACAGDDINATFADAGVPPGCAPTVPAISGTVAPAVALSGFDGESSTGTWTLTVQDQVVGSSGALSDWSLAFNCFIPPVVTITATDPTATEGLVDNGTFTFTRTGPTTDPLVVTYTIGGTATNGSDYVPLLTGMITIPAGAASVTQTIAAGIESAAPEPDETVILTLAASATYTVGAPATATVAIIHAPPVPIPVTSPLGLLVLACFLAALGAFAVLRMGR